MKALRDHYPAHMLGCGAAGLLVIAAIVFSIPIVAITGVLMCGAMMIGMIWMMISMASKGRH